MKQGLTIIARGAVYLIGIAVVVVCAILLPELAREEAVAHPNSDRVTYPFLIGAWIMAIPIFVALYQSLKLLRYLDSHHAFSKRSVQAIQNIKICAVIFASLIVLGAVTVIVIAKIADPGEDVTHIVTLGSVITFVSLTVATFAAVLQKLLQDAIAIKSENDLTI